MNYSKEFTEDRNEVTITFTDDNFFFLPYKNKSKTFKIVEKEVIYRQVSKKEKINLKDTFLKDFSFLECLEQFSLEKETLIHLNAKDAFFENVSFKDVKFGEGDVEFVGAQFGKGNVDFSGAQFGKGNVDFRVAQFGEGFVNFKGAKVGEGDFFFSGTKLGEGDVSFEGAQLGEGNVDFAQTKFGKGDINFKEAQLGEGDVFFLGTEFGKGNVDFSGAKFGEGDVDFSYTKFGEGFVNFKGTKLGAGNVDFLGAKFGEGDVLFSSAQFGEGYVSFSGAEFGKGRVEFLGAKFGEGYVSFSSAKFGEGNVSFAGAQLGEGNVDFSGAKFGEGYVKFSNITIKTDWNLKNITTDRIDFSKSMIHGTIDFIGSQTKISQFGLNETKLTGRIFIGSKELKLSNKYDDDNDVINQQSESNYLEKSYQFRLLKENFRNLGQYDDEDKAYIQFKRNELLHEKKVLQKKWEQIFYEFKIKYKNIPIRMLQFFWLKKYYYQSIIFIKQKLFQDIGLFGTSPSRVACYMAKTVFVFTGIYFLFFLFKHPVIAKGSSLASASYDVKLVYSFYHSIVTFLTIGYGDIQPSNLIGIVLSGIEGFIGLFLMSYFTVAFVRKVLR